MVLHLSTCHSLLRISLIRCWCSRNPVPIHHLGCIGCIYQTAATSGNWNISSSLRKPRLGGCLQQYGDPWSRIRLAGASGVSCFLSLLYILPCTLNFWCNGCVCFPPWFSNQWYSPASSFLFVRVRLPEINGNVFFEALLMLRRGLTVRPHPARIFPHAREFPLPKK